MTRPPQTSSDATASKGRTGNCDQQMMATALMLARRGLGSTAPNPAVGAVVFDAARNEVVGRGWTQPGGRPHAETEALARAGERAQGATIYVTLEPCSHHGRTPPCADAIIAAGISRAVVAITDPDPRVAGRGLDRLEAAGIAVRRGVLAREARWVTLGHIQRVTERRPFVQVKMAVAADGSVATGSGTRPTWVTGPEARAHGHLLRAEADAILVGGATVAADDPDLTCRLPGLGPASPIRVALAGTLLPDPGRRLVATANQTPTWVLHAAGADMSQLATLAAAGCHLVPVTALAERLWLPAALEAMVARGVTRLLVEGGPTVWRAFLAAGLVDEIVVYVAPPTSGSAPHAPADLAASFGARGFALHDLRPVGGDGDQVAVLRRRFTTSEVT